MGAPAGIKKVLFVHERAQRDSAKGGNKSGKVMAPSGHCPVVPSTPKAESPGRLRLTALESGFSSFKTEIASMLASLQGRFTASHPPDPKDGGSRLQDGGAHVERFFPHGNWRTHLLANSPVGGMLGPEALPLVGRAPGCDLSDPSHVMEPRGPLVTRLWPWTQSMAISLASALLKSLQLPSEELFL